MALQPLDFGSGAEDDGEVLATAFRKIDEMFAEIYNQAIPGLTPTDGGFIVGDGSDFVVETGNTARTSLGLGTGNSPTFANPTVTTLEIGNSDTTLSRVSSGVAAIEGSNILLASGLGSITQAYDAGLADIAALAVTDGNIIVGNGTNWVTESGATARTSLGLGATATAEFDGLWISHLTNGITLGDGTDADVSIFKVDRATDTPAWDWDDDSEAWRSNKPIVIDQTTGGDVTHTIAGAAVVSQIELHSEGAADLGGLTIHRHTDSNDFGGHLIFLRSDGSHATPGVPDDTDTLARLVGGGYDGTDYELAAEIRYVIDGTPGNNDMPGAIDFYTNAGSQTLTRRMRIRADGSVEVVAGPFVPSANDGAALGTTALGWADLFLASGGTLHFANTDWVATHTTGILTVGTGDLRVTTAGTNTASVATVGGTQTLTAKSLTSPTITTSPTAAGATWTDLGAATTIDINGGTIDGVIIGGAAAAAGTFTGITSPTLTGGAGTGSTLTLKSTTGIGATDAIIFQVGNNGATEAGRFDNAGHLLVNTAADLNVQGAASIYTLSSTDASLWLQVQATFSNDAFACGLGMVKSRGASVGSHTIVQNGDQVGAIYGVASDGTNYIIAASIIMSIDGTPGTNDMPGMLTFQTTADGMTTPLERLRIDSSGHIIALSATATPPTLGTNGQWVMTPTSNTNMRISYRGSDGTTRVADITLA